MGNRWPMADTIEGKHGLVRKNDWQDVRVCYRCGVLFLPMVKKVHDDESADVSLCPRCDEPVILPFVAEGGVKP